MAPSAALDLGAARIQARWRPMLRTVMLSLLVVLALLLGAGVAAGSLALLSAVRAYAGAGSQWAHPRGQAVEALRDYARSHDPADYQRFQAALQEPLSLRAARIELERPQPDLARVRNSLQAGGHDPANAPRALLLLRRLGGLPTVRASLAAWRDGDERISLLQGLADRMHQQASGPWPQVGVLDLHLQQLARLDADLMAAEQRFATEAARSARMLEGLLGGGLLVVGLLLGGTTLWLLRRGEHERAARERALAEATERWALAAEAGGLGLYDWTIADDRLELDAKAAAMYGLGQGHGVRVQRATLTALILPEDLAATRQVLDEAIRTGALFKARYRVRLPGGVERHLEATGMMQPRGVVPARRMVGVVRDVTEEEVRARVASERDAAERSARARMEFLSRLSHELRTPLNAILGFAQLLALDEARPLSREQGQRVQLILDGGRQLLTLVEEVLDLTRIDAGGIGVDLQPVDVVAVARASVAMVDGAMRARALQLVDRLPAEPLWAQADAARLQQVLMNLLSNACKYNRPGGDVLVEAGTRAATVWLSVADTGPGLTPDEQAQLFQPFKRLPSHAARADGTGLGLFIVKSLMEHMQGTVAVHSEWGHGARFTVALPAGEFSASPSTLPD